MAGRIVEDIREESTLYVGLYREDKGLLQWNGKPLGI